MQLYPADVDHEKTLLLLTMLVAKKVADHSPALLQDVFHTTVTFINQNLLAYVRNLVQNVRASGGSSWALNRPWCPPLPSPAPSELWDPHCRAACWGQTPGKVVTALPAQEERLGPASGSPAVSERSCCHRAAEADYAPFTGS